MKFFHLHSNVQIRLAVEFLTTMASMAVLPFVAIYFAGRIGGTVVGFMLMAIVLAGISGGLIGGYYSDRMGRKKVMIAADCATMLTFAGIAVVNSPWYDLPYVTFLLFLPATFFGGVMGPVARAMIIDVSSPENRKFIFTLSYWAMNLAVAIGGTLGAFLFESYHFELFLGVAGVSFVSLLMTIFFLSETYFPDSAANGREDNQQKSGLIASYGTVLKDKVFMMYVVAGVLLFSLDQQLTNYIGVRLGEKMPSQELFSIGSVEIQVDGIKMLGFLQTENTLIVVLFTVLVAALMKRYADHWILYLGIGLFTIGYFALGLSVNPWILFAAMAVISIGEVMYIPVMEAYLADIAPENGRSSYMAMNRLTSYGAMMIAAIFVTLGAVWPFWVIAGLFFVMGGAGLLLFQRIVPRLHVRRADSNSGIHEKSGDASV
ncbi:MAG TPA: MFS transporter [Bacillales bacterium]|nr:MFS transporter [Bacillales bacterium]